MTSKEILEKLSAPFTADEIEWRAGSTNKEKTQALALAYINARSVMNRLDDVVGAENWSDSYQIITGEGKRGYICTLSLRLNNEWIGKSDGADESDFEATKGGLSDAFKRAANKWGIGRYLYNLDAVWVPCQEFGRTVKLTKTPQLPAWALPQKNKALEEFEKAQAQKAKAATQQTPELDPKLGADLMVGHVEKITEPEAEVDPFASTRNLDPKTLTIAQAKAVRSGTNGQSYGDLQLSELTSRFNSMSKELKDKSSHSGDEIHDYEVRTAAVKLILKEINAK
jgi:hypothetical protein